MYYYNVNNIAGFAYWIQTAFQWFVQSPSSGDLLLFAERDILLLLALLVMVGIES
jgi:hypothetical protein